MFFCFFNNLNNRNKICRFETANMSCHYTADKASNLKRLTKWKSTIRILKKLIWLKNSANYGAVYAKPCLVNVNVRNKVVKSRAQDRPVQGDRHYWSKCSLLQNPKVNCCHKNSKILYRTVSKFNPAHNLVFLLPKPISLSPSCLLQGFRRHRLKIHVRTQVFLCGLLLHVDRGRFASETVLCLRMFLTNIPHATKVQTSLSN